jgi:ATP-dependent helicase/nuclease subunit B
MLFDSSSSPRVFVQNLGTDFAASVVAGLRSRLIEKPPHEMARVTLLVNTTRMARRIRQLFTQGPAGFVPRILLLSQVEALLPVQDVPPARHPLQRRLRLAELIAPLLKDRPELAAQNSVFALSDSLASLMDEMQGENVSVEEIAQLDVSDQSGHWQNAKALIVIAHQFVQTLTEGLDAEARNRFVVNALTKHWEDASPQDPIVLVGSTGSRGTTSLLMQAIAHLPQGAVVLPGFDPYMPAPAWRDLQQSADREDHPQYRFAKLFSDLDLAPWNAPQWHDVPPLAKERMQTLSLALRPAPITHVWRSEGSKLPELDTAFEHVSYLEAPSARAEAMAIALRLRRASEDGQTAALITPDRLLGRQVSAALKRWGITPDDSAGLPLHLSAPGRFLRHTAELLSSPIDAEKLLVLLKHPLTQSGEDHPKHGLYTQELELRLRGRGQHAQLQKALNHALLDPKRSDDAMYQSWINWLVNTFTIEPKTGLYPISDWLTWHKSLSERISGNPSDPGELWLKKAGRVGAEIFQMLIENAPYGGDISATDYNALLLSALKTGEVRDRDAPHPGIMIWGTLEARVQGAELVILAGLNEGTWPEPMAADPWLNRKMRRAAGLLMPDRRIGLAGHDFQQAMASQEVWITRSIRSDESETVPSRWLNRLMNLLGGLPARRGPQALGQMRLRGQYWLAQVQALERVTDTPVAKRPAPCPPVPSRPRAFSVTEIKTLIRDPYAIYAKHCLKLRRLNPLVIEPDALLRGVVIHEILHRFVKQVCDDPSQLTRGHFLNVAQEVLHAQVPWPGTRLLWQARLERVADWFVETEIERQAQGRLALAEETAKGRLVFEELGVTVRGQADRIDLTPDGAGVIYDYKSGPPPSKDEQTYFEKQLLIEAVMLEQGGFKELGPIAVDHASYIGLAIPPKEVRAPLESEPVQKIYAGLKQLLETYLHPDQPYISRRMVKTESHAGDFDHLARFGEWDGSEAAEPEVLT